MKFPAMNKRARQAIVVPELSGGLNLRDSVSMINDNQLTDCKNVWFRDGVLKTRPAIASTKFYEMPQGFYDEHTKAHDIYTEKQFADNSGNAKNETCRLFSQYINSLNEIDFYWVGETYFEHLGALANENGQYFVVQKDYLLYCYMSDGIYKLDFSADELTWAKVSEEEMYIPFVMVDCANSGTKLSGVMYEGYNLLSRKYKMKFNLDRMNGQFMQFTLPHKFDFKDVVVSIEYDNANVRGTVDHKIGEYEKDTADGLIMYQHPINVNCVCFTAKTEYTGSGHEDFLPDIAQIKDGKIYDSGAATEVGKAANVISVTITATNCDDNSEEEFKKAFNKVTCMSHCTWFGGDSAGINGGTRLFLGGNTEEPNLVVWSDLNNPLYFPENNYFYVGESSSAVTAFGKQSDMLVIFKNNETYYTQYNRNTNITADNLIDQSVVDYVGSSVYFPLTLIHSTIGCDCPDSVQLCRNRLVWAGSDGKIYTLVTNNQYSERNIYEIGEMIGRKLKEDNGLKTAHSTDWNGYYLLQSGTRFYVLDYNSYGYQYISSYSKTEDANLRIPWYYWEFELTQGKPVPSIIAAVDGRLKMINNSNYGIFVGEIAEDGALDNMLISDPPTTSNYIENIVPINCFMQTKLFEFGAQGYLKNVDKVMLSLGNNGGEPIHVEFVTDEGNDDEYITLEGEDTKAYSAGYVKSSPMHPCIRAVERFGVKLSCEGPLAVDGITLFYRVLGGAK